MRNKVVLGLGVGLLCCTASSAGATTSTANMNVSIQITAGCNVSVTNINFGSIPSTGLVSAQTSTPGMGGLFSYTCSPGALLPALTAGQGANYKAPNNQMKGATTGALLPYTLTLPALANITGATQTAQITATIPAQTTVPGVDSYADTVVLTLTY